MESKSLQFNGITFSVFQLGEKAWLLEPENKGKNLEVIHDFTRAIEKAELAQVIDIIPAYTSVTILVNKNEIDITSLLADITQLFQELEVAKPNVHEIKVCYELGLDWDEIEESTNLQKNEIVTIHSSREYTVAMTGFLPGFMFLEGLDENIAVSRKETPRTSIPAGSVGIAGNQTGIYSLESPGGWQILGRTPQSFFKVDRNPPMEIKAGDKVKFIPISESEFEEMEKKNG